MTLKKLPIDKTWTLFLDRDGVINERKVGGYVENKEEWTLLSGALEAMSVFSRFFGKIFIVTNQQGIGKGVMTETSLKEIHDALVKEVEQEGGFITKIYYESGLAGKENKRRKPNIGMGRDAKKEYPDIDFQKAIMVGDSDSDIIFGKRLGMWTVKVGAPFPKADFVVEHLIELSEQLVS